MLADSRCFVLVYVSVYCVPCISSYRTAEVTCVPVQLHYVTVHDCLVEFSSVLLYISFLGEEAILSL